LIGCDTDFLIQLKFLSSEILCLDGEIEAIHSFDYYYTSLEGLVTRLVRLRVGGLLGNQKLLGEQQVLRR
jgi:hypothetical protein